MGERTAYTNGVFSWVENATTDQDGAKGFSATLFGWEYDDRPVGDGIVYSMAQLNGKNVAAISPQMQDERDQGVPPHWNNYITVENVDAVTQKVGELGGQVLAGPFDVMEAGRMSAFMDPTGAVAFLWQAQDNLGADLVNVPGAFCWNELATRDTQASERFYSQLFGWKFERAGQTERPPYWTIESGERQNGGMRQIGDELPPGTPSHWLVYFAVEDVNATADLASGAGGRVMLPKTDVWESSAFAVLADPAGAPFAIFEGWLDD
jgi:predicted enzyme related to lactoylglutathione lyase